MPWPFSCCSSNQQQKTFIDDEPSSAPSTSKGKVGSSNDKYLPPIPTSIPLSQTITGPPHSTKATTPVVKKTPSVNIKAEQYSASKAAALFATYADNDDPNIIAAEGFEKLCNEAQIPIDGAQPMILSWQVNSKEMMKVTKEEWLKGTDSLKVTTLAQLAVVVKDLENLLISGKPPIGKGASGPKKDPYNRDAYWRYANDAPAAFRQFYTYCFNLAKPEQSRNIDMDTSMAFWSVLLVPKYPIMEEVLAFVAEEKASYKATNKDLWSMMLEFCETVKPSLEDYEPDGAWPTLLDNFAAWKKGGSQENGVADE